MRLVRAYLYLFAFTLLCCFGMIKMSFRAVLLPWFVRRKA